MHEGKMITRIAVSLWIVALAVSAAAPVCAQQTADDRKWIDQCVSDNKDEGQTPRVIVAYCTCMNNRMSSDQVVTAASSCAGSRPAAGAIPRSRRPGAAGSA